MKTINFNRLVFLLLLSITMVSCSKDDDNDSGVNSGATSKVSFIQENHTITPQMDSIIIPLKLEPKAIKDGFVTVELTGNATYGSDYTTFPEVSNGKVFISLAINTQAASLIVYKANQVFASEKTLNLKLASPTLGFSIGNMSTTLLTFNVGNSLSNRLNFSSASNFTTEDDTDGMAIELNTTSTVVNGDFAKIKVHSPQGKVYGTHFYTIPSAVLDEISIEFAQNSQQANFKIIPIDDHVVLGDYSVVFEIIEANGSLEVGDNNFFTANIVEDDNQPSSSHSIAELKTNFSVNQNDWFIPTDYYIEGVVTSDGNVIDNKSIYIQDATSGILLRFSAPNIFYLGDKIKINLKNASGRVVNGEKRIDYLNISQAVKYAENIVVQPEIITINQLNTGNYEGKRVKLEGVYFENANGVLVFEGNHFIKQGNLAAVVTTYPSATFKNYILPEGTISVTGIVSNWNYILPQKYSHDITN